MDLSGEIQSLDLQEEFGCLSPAQLDRRRILKSQLSDLAAEEEVLWKSRAKQHWLREGDSNTKFFHAVANGRRRSNFIEVVEDEGYRICREREKSDYFYAKFKEVFAPAGDSLEHFGDWSDLFASNPLLGAGSLTAPFTREEIKSATFQLGGDKAPGADGFSLRFYQKFWGIIQDDIYGIFADLYEGNLNTGPIDYSFIALVPKIEGAKAAGDFRPICLLNGIQKIISKVLANRLGRVLGDIISPSQTAFLKGRSILDSFVTASELVNWGSKVKAECVGIKVDFEKAYDRVNWKFLLKVLRWLGANQLWCGWIEQCIINAKIAVLVNGSPTKWIKTKRGLRQGDPLSPLLFFLVAEALARMTGRAVTNNLISGMGPGVENKVSILQYDDDTIFFCQAKTSEVRNLKFMWQLFEWASGLRINRLKSELSTWVAARGGEQGWPGLSAAGWVSSRLST